MRSIVRRALILVAALVLPVLQTLPVAAYGPSVMVSPSSGPAGSAVTVNASGYTPGFTVEVHAGTVDGPLLGSAATNGSGSASVPITIPSDAPSGPYVLVACASGSGIVCGDEFSQPTSTVFTVQPPTVVTPAPTTSFATTTTIPEPTPAGACTIPPGAIHLDFDEFDAGDSPLSVDDPAVAAALSSVGFLPFTYANPHVFDASGNVTASGGITPGSAEGTMDIRGIAARDPEADTWLGTSSPPNVLRAVGPGAVTIEAFEVLPAGMDYLGFNLGLGHYSEGFERPEYVVYRVVVYSYLIRYDGTSFLEQWDPVSVTLGPGPQPVNTCVYLQNTLDVFDVDPSVAVWRVGITPSNPDGSPIERVSGNGGIFLEMDDWFYGSTGLVALPPGAVPEPSITVGGAITVAGTLPDTEQPDSSGLPLIVIVIVIGGLVAVAGVAWMLRARSRRQPPPSS